ncbi:MAG: ABC transporter ATP-binding protein [Pelosinus sp.]|nr:ABC transporter ATP-binding protein [Pelosinus sp.]
MLKLENLSVAVNGRQILHDVNLHIKPGEVHVLFGPNGTGKSTLIGAIMGFARYKITDGKIYFNGQEITNLSVDERARRGLGVMIQRPPTLRGLSVREIVHICGKNDVDVELLADKTNMLEFLDRGVNDGFSGGEIKRSELLQLMAQQPDLLMLDEPESGVDIENIAVVGEAANYILERGSKKKGKSIKKCRTNRHKSGLIITHTGHILEYVPADMAHVMYNGTLSCSGNPQEMLSCIHQKGYEECINCAE